MSSVVRTATPFINRELLLKALDAVGCRYTIQGDQILTDRQDYYGAQKFVLQNGRYVFIHEKHAQNYSWGNINMQQYKSSSSFIAAVGREYNSIYAKQLEELERKRLATVAEEERKKAEKEKQRLERERKEFVEKQRTAIIAKAKEQGYDIQETMVDNKIKLVLVQTTY
jgi:hypothetical protein